MRLTFVNIKIHIVPFKNQTQNSITSTNLLMCKFFGFCTVSIELRANHPKYIDFPANCKCMFQTLWQTGHLQKRSVRKFQGIIDLRVIQSVN